MIPNSLSNVLALFIPPVYGSPATNRVARSPHNSLKTQKVVEVRVRREMEARIRKCDALLEKSPVVIEHDAAKLLERRRAELDGAVRECRWERIIKMCSLKNSPALDTIGKHLGFKNEKAYEQHVLKRLRADKDLRNTVRGFLGDLYEKLMSDGASEEGGSGA